jgi:hypothetical protein
VRRPTRRPWRVGIALLLFATACTPFFRMSGPDRTPATTGGIAVEFVIPPPTTGDESTAAVRARLCVRPPITTTSPAAPETPPAAIAEVEHEVEQVRGLDYEHSVAIEPVTHDQLVQGLDASFDHSYPSDMLERRSQAWSTIGVIPADSSLRDAYRGFFSTQVIGYYDPATGQLVFLGTGNPSPEARFILAHELTHADDDQHFDLARLNDVENACDDEALQAATGAVEGSAVFFSETVVATYFTPKEQREAFSDSGGGPPASVPPFVYQLEVWPYQDGPRFIQAIEASGGLDEVNSALETFPPSTEQVIHPERFPSDRPVTVDVPDLGPALGAGWHDLDVMQTGEEWLRTALGLRLSSSEAATAAEGWGGAEYRAWTDGTHVAVVLETTWDTSTDQQEFLDAMRAWTGGDDTTTAVGTAGGIDRGVVALFASDPDTLNRLEAALR